MAAPLEKSAETQFSTTFKQNDKEAKKQKLQGINDINILLRTYILSVEELVLSQLEIWNTGARCIRGALRNVLFALSLPHYNLCYMPLPLFQK